MKYLVAIIPIFIMMTLAPALMAGNGSVFAQSPSQQIIEQAQSNAQAALCASGANTTFSCNNTSSQSQNNTGNNALAQQGGSGGNGGSGENGGNSAEQGIGQS